MILKMIFRIAVQHIIVLVYRWNLKPPPQQHKLKAVAILPELSVYKKHRKAQILQPKLFKVEAQAQILQPKFFNVKVQAQVPQPKLFKVEAQAQIPQPKFFNIKAQILQPKLYKVETQAQIPQPKFLSLKHNCKFRNENSKCFQAQTQIPLPKIENNTAQL